MSRSFKHVPGFTDNSCSHENRQIANRLFRRAVNRGLDVQDGNWYRRYTDPWNIHDYKFLYFTKREIEESWQAEEGKKYRIFMK
jgi:hypothetical protein